MEDKILELETIIKNQITKLYPDFKLGDIEYFKNFRLDEDEEGEEIYYFLVYDYYNLDHDYLIKINVTRDLIYWDRQLDGFK